MEERFLSRRFCELFAQLRSRYFYPYKFNRPLLSRWQLKAYRQFFLSIILRAYGASEIVRLAWPIIGNYHYD